LLAHHYPFVGRVPELQALRAGLDDLLSRHPRLFLLTGEAGIGKTEFPTK
jgi:predicted ATPase